MSKPNLAILRCVTVPPMLALVCLRCFAILILILACPHPAQAQDLKTNLPSDTPTNFSVNTNSFDYVKREEMIPMRDGVKLHTVIVIPKGARNAPIILTRTPYNASKRTETIRLMPSGMR